MLTNLPDYEQKFFQIIPSHTMRSMETGDLVIESLKIGGVKHHRICPIKVLQNTNLQEDEHSRHYVQRTLDALTKNLSKVDSRYIVIIIGDTSLLAALTELTQQNFPSGHTKVNWDDLSPYSCPALPTIFEKTT